MAVASGPILKLPRTAKGATVEVSLLDTALIHAGRTWPLGTF